ncbi:pirin family protein [Acinetobacter sp. ANC 4945]|uniref:Quercetin 2,3-dioxygenase n=1 Tax=Acinetobacter amyesii TaxID=2942470 RepID=A0A1T1GYG0_9GAMM|nr:pirin family protein [Acinetobacter amyesii]MCL6246619.1 pirin family protein [Acinetobacter amyesii]OOV82575.1 quercetin 2,3-dioxygenase [Acinetobacter amyesii]
MNPIKRVYHSDRSTWVGDGFPTNSMLPMQEMGNQTSPFLVMGYTGQYHFSPSHHQRGIGSHPHRGFETVTIVYEGELEHFDSKGNHGSIAKDEVQWMTAGRGIMHEEHHSKDFAKTGGNLDMVQLWVNLPSHAKMTEPRYQELTTANIAEVKLSQKAGVVRVIAGQFEDTLGAAETFSPMNVLDVRLNANAEQEFSFNPQWNNMIFVLSGAIEIEGQRFDAKQTLYVSDQVSSLKLKSFEATKLLILSGEALNEPIAAHGPFVMNTEDEIRQAFYDFQHGHFA